MASRFERFKRDRGGNVAILFAAILVPMLGLLGLAVNFSMAVRAKTALDASTDAAVLAAVTEASQIIQTQSTAGYDATAVAISQGTIAGQQVFSANSAMVQTTTTPALNLQLQRPNNGMQITATGSYSAQWPTVFGKMFGQTTLSVAGKAASSLTLPKFMNIYVAADISQSMGIGASQADMSALANRTGGCVFGCHVKQNGQSQSQTYEVIAHSAPPLNLRIDVVKAAINNMILSAQSLSNGTPTISIGLYTLQDKIPADNTNYYNVLSKPSTDYTALSTLANGIDLGNNDGSGVGDSNFNNSVSLFSSNEVSTSGSGSSTSNKQNFVFIMTDGVQDIYGHCGGRTHCTQAFDPSLCAALKSRGVTVGVIYTTYIPQLNEQNYMALVYPIQSQIAPNLQACATPGWYYEASDGADINAAMNTLFTQAVSSGTLTQ